MSARRRPPRGARPLLVVHGHRVGHAPGGRTEISDECVARVRRAERVARRRRIEWVLFCGAGAPEAPSEARQMAQVWKGPPVHVLLDERSTDTAENAAEALNWARMVGASDLLVVSSWWHLRLRLYYRGRPFQGLRARRIRSWRCKGVIGHLCHELRYLPEALTARSGAGQLGSCRREESTG